MSTSSKKSNILTFIVLFIAAILASASAISNIVNEQTGETDGYAFSVSLLIAIPLWYFTSKESNKFKN